MEESKEDRIKNLEDKVGSLQKQLDSALAESRKPRILLPELQLIFVSFFNWVGDRIKGIKSWFDLNEWKLNRLERKLTVAFYETNTTPNVFPIGTYSEDPSSGEYIGWRDKKRSLVEGCYYKSPAVSDRIQDVDSRLYTVLSVQASQLTNKGNFLFVAKVANS